jgi:hypothetical protein
MFNMRETSIAAGIHMNISYSEINYMRRQKSPTECLLDTWGQKNHTVQELYVIFAQMEHYRAMKVIAEFSE